MKKFFAEFTTKVAITVTASVLGGFLYEQARQVGRKSTWLVKHITEWDKKFHHGDE